MIEQVASNKSSFLLKNYFLNTKTLQLFTKIIKMEKYHILSSIVCTFYNENDAEIFPVHYTWKVAERGFKMAFMMNELARINSC
jgi:hypothetical protein